jgi:hypothetical protein
MLATATIMPLALPTFIRGNNHWHALRLHNVSVGVAQGIADDLNAAGLLATQHQFLAQFYVLGYHWYLAGIDHDPFAFRYRIITGLLPISWPAFHDDGFIMHLDVAFDGNFFDYTSNPCGIARHPTSRDVQYLLTERNDLFPRLINGWHEIAPRGPRR